MRTVRTMTLEQAIASYGKSAERYHKAFLHCKAHGGEFYQEEAESNKICYEHDRQLAEWLRELQERRKAPEIVYCKDCKHLYNVIRGNQGVCHTFNGFSSLVKFNDYCSRAERRTDD